MIELESHELKDLMIDLAYLGAAKLASDLGLGPSDEISQREAYRLYNEARVKRWRREGKIKRIKEGQRNSKASYSRIELEAISRAEHIKGNYR